MSKLCIDLGSGRQAMECPDHVHIDIADLPHIEYVWDLNFGLPRIDISAFSFISLTTDYRVFKDNTVDEFRAHHIFEHIDIKNFISLLNEIWDALKPDGILKVYVPNASHIEAAWSDPTHVRTFTPKTFWYFTKEGYDAYAYTNKTWTILDGYPKINGTPPEDLWEIEVLMRPNK
jgi:hypothetical protein